MFFQRQKESIMERGGICIKNQSPSSGIWPFMGKDAIFTGERRCFCYSSSYSNPLRPALS